MRQLRKGVRMNALAEQLVTSVPFRSVLPGCRPKSSLIAMSGGRGQPVRGRCGETVAADHDYALPPPPPRSRERLTSRREVQVRQLASFGRPEQRSDSNRPIGAGSLSAGHFRAALGSLASVASAGLPTLSSNPRGARFLYVELMGLRRPQAVFFFALKKKTFSLSRFSSPT